MGEALYNEIDPFAAVWLRRLIAAGQIAPGVVDDRSIVELDAAQLVGVGRFHAFAGIGGWDLALRLAGWPADRPVWTGSCPCQSWSSAGKGLGAADPRHLWPVWFRLIDACRPAVVFGEQVAASSVVGAVGKPRGASAVGDRAAWLDLVSADLESIGYTVGAVVLTASSVGAPHIRSRLYFCALRADGMAHGDSARQQREHERDLRAWQPDADRRVTDGAVADRDDVNAWARVHERSRRSGEASPDTDGDCIPRGLPDRYGPANGSGVGDSNELGTGRHRGAGARPEETGTGRWRVDRDHGVDADTPSADDGPTRGAWRDAEWIACTDGKSRPTQPGVHPLAPRLPRGVGSRGTARRRVGSLKGYGNAIVPQVAAAFIRAVMDELEARAV